MLIGFHFKYMFFLPYKNKPLCKHHFLGRQQSPTSHVQFFLNLTNHSLPWRHPRITSSILHIKDERPTFASSIAQYQIRS